ELCVRLEEDERNLVGDVVLEVRADLLVRALGIPGNRRQVRLEGGVVVDLEMIGRIHVPVERVVVRIDLAEVGNEGRLRGGRWCRADQQRGDHHADENRNEQMPTDAHACLYFSVCGGAPPPPPVLALDTR